MINEHCVGHYIIVKSTIDKNMIDKAIKLFGLDCNTRFESPLDHIEEGTMERTMASWNLIYVTPEGRLSYRDSINSFMTQRSFEELDIKTNLQSLNSPFGELDKQTKKDLLCAWVDGAEIEFRNFIGVWVKVMCVGDIEFYQNTIYRVKPTLSAKDADKAKLISEAQQQLRDAQEALDKAQQL